MLVFKIIVKGSNPFFTEKKDMVELVDTQGLGSCDIKCIVRVQVPLSAWGYSQVGKALVFGTRIIGSNPIAQTGSIVVNATWFIKRKKISR